MLPAIARAEQVLAAGVDGGGVVRRDARSAHPSWRGALRCRAPARARSCPTCSSCGDRRWRRCGSPGRMSCTCQVRVSLRWRPRNCDDEKTTRGSFGIRHRVEAVAAAQARPVLVQDAVRRSTPRSDPPSSRCPAARRRRCRAARCPRPRGSTATAAAICDVEELQAAIVRDADAAVVQLDRRGASRAGSPTRSDRRRAWSCAAR